VPPQAILGVERVACMKILGVWFDETLSFKTHFEKVLSGLASSVYALKVLRSKGLRGEILWDVTRQTAIAKMLYASPVWWSHLDSTSCGRLNAIIKRFKKYSFLPSDFENFEDLCNQADHKLFKTVLGNSDHVLHHTLPSKKTKNHNLRDRAHDRSLPLLVSSQQKKTFLNRMLFDNMY